MFSITSFSDVVAVAKTFGTAALQHVLNSNSLGGDASTTIIDCRRWAANTVIEVLSFNDGNNEFTITAHFNRKLLGGHYYTSLNDIHIIRTGIGSFNTDVTEAMNNKEITADTLRFILAEINARNDAAIALSI